MEIKKLEVGAYQANCYIILGEDRRALIIDPGDEPERIAACVQELGAEPEAIFLTHGHFDHIAGAPFLAKLWQIPIILQADEVIYMEDRRHPMMEMTAGILDDLIAALPQNGRYVSDQEEFEAAGLTWRVIEVPGHSDHSLCLYCEKEGVVFSGDTLFAGSVGRTGLYHGGPQDLVGNLKKTLLVLPEDTKVYPGHGPATVLAKEKQTNPFFGRI